MRHPRRQSELLRKIIDRVRNSLELNVVLQTTVEEVATLLQLDRCYFFWYFHDTKRVQIVCEWMQPTLTVEAPACEAPSSSLSKGLGYHPLEIFGSASEAIALGELVVNHGRQTLCPLRHPFDQWIASLRGKPASVQPTVMGATASLLVPVRFQENSIGFLACLSDQARRWSPVEIEFLQSIAQQLEIAINQAQLYEKTQKQAQRERLVNQITAQTRQSFDLETILSRAIAQLLTALQIDRCLVHLVEDPSEGESSVLSQGIVEHGPDTYAVFRRKHLYEVCSPGFSFTQEDFDTNGPITRWVIDNRRRVAITDISQDERIGPDNEEYQKAQIKSSLVVPVETKDRLYAILYLNQCSHVRYWSINDQKLAQAVADQLAISIQQAYLYAQTRQQAAESAAQAKNLAATLQELRLTQAQLIQSEKMSSLGRMVAGVAHEINNPINFIYGNIPYLENYVQDLLQVLRIYQQSEIALDPKLEDVLNEVDLEFLLTDMPQILSSMKVGADRIRRLVLSLRNFSRLDEAQCKTVNLHEGIESTLLMLQSHFKDIEIVREYGDLPLVKCYPGQLNQVMMNLLMNAVEALHRSQQPQKTITIRTEAFYGEGYSLTHPSPLLTLASGAVAIAITDNGPGIPYDIQPKVFDPFFTTKEVGQGAGLGLTVSYQAIVNLHHGQLTFHSEPNFGTEFRIEIPVNPACLLHARKEPWLVAR